MPDDKKAEGWGTILHRLFAFYVVCLIVIDCLIVGYLWLAGLRLGKLPPGES